jgi:hypothetical protein
MKPDIATRAGDSLDDDDCVVTLSELAQAAADRTKGRH